MVGEYRVPGFGEGHCINLNPDAGTINPAAKQILEYSLEPDLYLVPLLSAISKPDELRFCDERLNKLIDALKDSSLNKMQVRDVSYVSVERKVPSAGGSPL